MNNSFYIIRRAKVEELSILSDLAILSKSYWGYDKEFISQCVPLLSIDQDNFQKSTIYVYEEQSTILGFYQLKEIDNVIVDLDKLFIHPEAIKRGIGKKLFDHAKEKVQELGFTSLIIESDPNAKGFYEKQGGFFTNFSISPIDESRKLPNYRVHL